MIELKNIIYTAADKKIIDGISFTAENAKITALIGPNGSGKTTLLRSVTNYYDNRRNIRGEILIDGVSITEIKQSALTEKISLLPQTTLAPDITVEELVEMGRRTHRSPFSRLSGEDAHIVSDALSAMGLEPLRRARLPILSGGERQAAYFAMLLAWNADNVILDEPVSNLDSNNRARLFSFMKRMRGEGRAVLVVLHDITDAAELADKIVVLDGGDTVFDGTPEEFKYSGIAQRVFSLAPYTASDGEKCFTVYRPIR